MNNDDDRISPHPSHDHALEARIVAWVMGEASEFEIAELTRILAERPALAAFKARIETTHRLVREAAGPEKHPLKLSGDRRVKLLAALGVEPELTGKDESSNEVPFEPTKAAAADIPAASSAAPAPAAKTKSSEKSTVLTYPMPQRGKSSVWFRGLSIACSVMLTFMILHVTVLAPRPHEARKSALLEKKPFELMAREKSYFSATQRKKSHAEREEKEITPVQLPSSAPVEASAGKGGLDLAENTKSDKKIKQDAENKTSARRDSDEQVTTMAKSGTTYKRGGDISKGSTWQGYFSRSGTGDLNHQQIRGLSKETSLDDSPSAAPINEKPVPLDSFDVTDNSGVSYTANSTLAGTRLRIPAPNLQIANLERGPNSILFGVGSPTGIVDNQKFGSTEPARRSYVDDLTKKKEGEANVAETSDEQIVLSPFEVSAPTKDSEYSATSTLAGTRIRTDLKDTSSAVSVVTKNFLEETGASDGSSLLNYSDHADTGGVEGNLSDAPTAPASEKPEEAARTQIWKPAPASQARSAAAAKPDSTGEQSTQTQPVSTFSLHVSDVSFRLSADALAAGERPDSAAIRPEEFYNAFDYGDPAPAKGEAVSCRIEQSAHPTKQQRNLVRIALRVPSTGRAASQPLHLTLLLDTSGSMQRRDRAASVKDAVASLISLLKPDDEITLIGFARTPHLLAESVAGNNAQQLLKIVAQTPAEGGTNLDAALTLAGELALRHQVSAGQNRIVLITDGAANLGDADPKALSQKIEELRQKGIAFDACGVGTSGLDDTMLESLTRHGDGRYLLLDRAAASVEFAKQLAGAFHPAAKNVKVQVRFNPNRVAHYRLLGFAQHRLKEEDFRNDKVDAAELAADEAANALYEVEPLPQGEGALGEVFVRFQDVATGQMIERSWTLPYDAKATRFDRASPSLQLAGTAALVAEYLQGRPVNLDDLVGPVNQLRDHYRYESRVQTLINMFDQLRRTDRRY